MSGVGRIDGAVLCGGASRRMGKDKALVVVDGRSMARRVADALSVGGCSAVAAIGGDESALIALGLRWVPDAHPGEGPLGGVLTALDTSAADAVLVAACDLPWLSSETVAMLVEAAAGAADVVIARTDRLEPMCAVWRSTTVDVVRDVFQQGGRAVAAALDRLVVEAVPVPASDLRNVNTPGDLRE